jgi:8-oxo-dGTP pyrophosphatase MutT (NUDIX family)
MIARAGILLVAYDTGRALFCERAGTGVWETPGGHVEPGEMPLEAALRELAEETDYRGRISNIIVAKRSFRFVLFTGYAPREFRPRVSEEHRRCGWFGADELPRPLHPGLCYLRPP